jgi:ketosteroid isomerase-like protein
MTIKQIATRMIALCAKKKFKEARYELYADDAVCFEADNKKLKGLKALDRKHEVWMGSMEKIHGLKISKPLINGNFFSIAYTWDVTYKGQERGGWKEIGVYEVKDGKVVLEKYFY